MKPALTFLLAFVLLPLGHTAPTTPEIISPQVKASVSKAVAWLLKQQQTAGHFSEQKSNQQPRPGDIPSHAAAMTSLALMGLASVGHLPGASTPESIAAQKALKFIVDHVEPDENGYLGRSDRSRMYGHGIMTLMLTEMLGMSPDEATDKKVREMAEKGIKLILRSQQTPKSEANRGGWRYEPSSSDSDIIGRSGSRSVGGGELEARTRAERRRAQVNLNCSRLRLTKVHCNTGSHFLPVPYELLLCE